MTDSENETQRTDWRSLFVHDPATGRTELIGGATLEDVECRLVNCQRSLEESTHCIVARNPDAWAPLNDHALGAFEYHGCSSGTSTPPMVRDSIVIAVAEIRRSRAMVKRLEAWAKEFDGDSLDNGGSGVGPHISNELRRRMKEPVPEPKFCRENK